MLLWIIEPLCGSVVSAVKQSRSVYAESLTRCTEELAACNSRQCQTAPCATPWTLSLRTLLLLLLAILATATVVWRIVSKRCEASGRKQEQQLLYADVKRMLVAIRESSGLRTIDSQQLHTRLESVSSDFRRLADQQDRILSEVAQLRTDLPMIQQQQQQLNCPVCFSPQLQETAVPCAMVPCGHIVCRACLDNGARTMQRSPYSVCAVCRGNVSRVIRVYLAN